MRRRLARGDPVREDNRHFLRGHAMFIRFMEKRGLTDCVHYFPDDMTLGQLRSTTPRELMNRYHVVEPKNRERILKVVQEAHLGDQSDTEVGSCL